MNIFLYSIIILVISILIYTIPNNPAFAINNFTNYTTAKYDIEFQYPSDWELKEKTSRFDEGADISIDSSSLTENGFISILYIDNLIEEFGSKDLRLSLFTLFKQAITNDYSKEYRVIEQPSLNTINGMDVGTFLYTHVDKYEDYAIKWAVQYWLVFNDDHGYLISYSSSADTFDKPENIEIRDKFINSIKFTNQTNTTQQ
jgi:hypothetical protein